MSDLTEHDEALAITTARAREAFHEMHRRQVKPAVL